MAVLEKIRAAWLAVTGENVRSYRELVEAAADGKDVDDLDAVAIISQAEKTVSEFEADVELLKQRREWAQQRVAAREAETRGNSARAEVMRLAAQRDAELARIRAPFDARIDTLNESLLGIDGIAGTGHQAELRLAETASQELKLREKSLTEQLRAMMPDLERLNNTIRDVMTGNRNAQATIDRLESVSGNEGDVENARRKIAANTAILESAKKHLARLEERRQQLLTQIAEVGAEKLVP